MKKYTLVQLMDILEKNSKEERKHHREWCEKHKLTYDDDEFMITEALYSMCEAICDRVKMEDD